MIYIIFPPTHTAGKEELASQSRSIGDSFFIPCNIEVGVNTAQTNYVLNIERRIFYPDRSTSSPLLQYHHNTSPAVLIVNSITEDPTSYKFYSSNLTLYMENFSVPSPQDVHGVKFICEFIVVSQGRRINAETTTTEIPGFCKFFLQVTHWSLIYCFLELHLYRSEAHS